MMIDERYSELIEKLENEVDANINNEQFGVDQLSAALGMSRSSLHRKLKKACGQSISQFIREYRLKKSHELLMKGNLTASEVAYNVGFGSATYFNKVYHGYFGYPPGETQARMKKKDKLAAKVSIWKGRHFTYLITGAVLLICFTFLFIWWQQQKVDVLKSSGDNSIAILPFDNLSTEEKNKYFADGINEAILNKLAEINALRVISKNTMEQYRDVAKSAPEISNELDVTYVLDGSAQKYGDEIRIYIRLIDAKEDRHIWSQTYSSSINHVLSLQSEIARKVAMEILTVLTPNFESTLNQRPTENTEAYQFYLMGNYQVEQVSKASFVKAEDFYHRAMKLDPLFVDAMVQLARIYTLGSAVYGFFDAKKVLPEAKALLLKAIDLQGEHLVAHDVLASYYFYHEWDFTNAQKHFEQVNKISGHYNYLAADFFIKMNDLKSAQAVIDYQAKTDPLYLFLNYGFISEIAFFKGEKEQSILTVDKAISLFGERTSLEECAKLYYLRGEMEKARNTLNTAMDNPSFLHIPLSLWLCAGLNYHEGKDPSPYLAKLDSLQQESSNGSPAWFLAIYHAEIDKEDLTFEWLQKSFDGHEVELTWLKMEPILQKYTNDPRYIALLEKVGFQTE